MSVNGKLEGCHGFAMLKPNDAVDTLALADTDSNAVPESALAQRYSAHFTVQVSILSERMAMKLRDAKMTLQNLLSFIGIGVVFMVLFLTLGDRDHDIYPRVSLAFVFAITCMWWPTFDSVFSLFDEEVRI